ncbi:MAG: sensor histidine kinase [Rhodospirillales bacterium]|nr:MAG: sensor histidine kinase [Rhodospirillales bacterium]
MRNISLTRRLALVAAVLIACSLFGAGVLLVYMFEHHIERRFDVALMDHLDELIAASEIDGAGRLKLGWTAFEPRFNRPGSGWYWQITQDGRLEAASDSLAGMRLALQGRASETVHEFDDPTGQPVRIFLRHITLPGVDQVFTYAVSGPSSDIQSDVRQFSMITAATLATLGAGLILAVLFQVQYGLRPLKGLRDALSDIRSGRQDRMPEIFPIEVEPVVDEVNALLDHNEAMLARARTQAGDLAHALKHPLMVIAYEARALDDDRGGVITEQVAAMRRAVDRNLARARSAGPSAAFGARAPLADAYQGLRFSLDLLYRDRALKIEAGNLDGLVFAGDAQDLEEMLGNLMDNACKWSRSRVRVSASRRDGALAIAVEDDGVGVAEDKREAVLARGGRLDEQVAGAGLGLWIVRDIAELYRGSLNLSESEFGGLRAELVLPATDQDQALEGAGGKS